MNKRWIVLGLSAALLVAACGGDDKSGSNDAGGSNSTFCQRAQKVNDLGDSLAGTANDPKAFEKAYKDLVKAAEDAVKAAPSSIKPAMQSQLDSAKQVIKIGDKYDWDPAKMDADAEFTALINSEDASQSVVDDYLSSECGIDTGNGTGSTETSAPGSGGNLSPVAAAFKQAFPSLTDDQAECLAGLGSNPTDQANILTAFQSCDIDPSVLGNG